MMRNQIWTSFDKWRASRRKNIERVESDMHVYQHTALQFIRDNPFCALFVDLGLGKTVTAMTAATEFLMNGEVNKVLIIAPLKVANKTWPDEFSVWEHTCCMSYQVLTGDAKTRAHAIKYPIRFLLFHLPYPISNKQPLSFCLHQTYLLLYNRTFL